MGDEGLYPGLSDLERLLLAFLEKHDVDDDGAFARYVEALGRRADGLPALRQEFRETRSVVQSMTRGSLGCSRGAGEPSLDDEDRASLLARLRALDRGEALGRRYEFGEQLARGGTSAIVAVRDREFGRDLVMKVLLAPGELRPDGFPASVGDDEARAAWLTPEVRRFVQEARVTARLEHPGILPVHDVGADARGRPYFTMKRVNGRTLDEIARDAHRARGGWSVNRAVSVLQRVCEAVSYAHSRGVLHGDLKPGNVMVGEFGETYVMDWGLCVPLGDAPVRPAKRRLTMTDLVGRTRSGSVFGTIPYMAPEQARGANDAIDERTDVYSIGAILYHVLTGMVPYSDVCPHLPPEVVLLKVRGAGPSSVRELLPEGPARLLEICERSMSRDPEGRHPTVARLGDELADYLADMSDDRRRAQTVSMFLQRMLGEHAPDRARGREVTVSDVVARAVEELDGDRSADPADEAELRLVLGRVWRQLDKREPALRQLERALQLFEESGRSDSRAGMQAEYEHCWLVERMGGRRKVIPRLEQLFERQERLLGTHDEDTLDTLFLLAEVFVRLGGRPQEARQYHELVYARRCATLGPGHPSSLDSKGCLASLAADRGDFETALAFLHEVLEGCVREWGDDHPQTIIAYSDVAHTLSNMERWDDALPHVAKAAQLSERVFGPSHLYTLTMRSNHGWTLTKLGRLDEADAVLSRAVEGLRASDLTRDRATHSLLNNVAVLRVEQGRPDEALAIYAEIFATAEDDLGSENPSLARFRSSFARLLMQLGRHREAIEALERALAVLLPEHGKDGAWTIEAIDLLERARRALDGRRDDPEGQVPSASGEEDDDDDAGDDEDGSQAAGVAP